MTMIIDSHCHLDGFFKSGQLDDVLSRAADVGVCHFVTIGTNSEECLINADLAKKFDQIDYTIGIHPLNVDAIKPDFEQFFLNKNMPCAIGEIGLDYHYLPDSDDRIEIIEKQKDIFREQLECAKLHDLPVTIHSRDAFDDTFEILVNSGIKGNEILFHCFSYSPREMEILMNFGTYVSFAGNVTYKNASSIREALKLANKDRVLLETDCPYLAPIPFRGKPNEPAFIQKTAEFISDFLGDDKFIDRAFENTVRFFELRL